MTSIKTALLLILAISFLVFVAFFGRLPALRRTPIAGLYRLIWIHIPNTVLAVDQAITGGRVSRYLLWFGNYMMNERHWTVVIFFLLILTIAEYLYLPEVWPQIGALTKITAAITVVLPYLFLYLACSADPGYITSENLPYYLSLYPYDHMLFHPGHECRTCRILKPARSKHCSICKRCVAKSDHHCIFINSCVGYGNQHYFVLLLLSTAILTTYGGLLGAHLMASNMKLRTPRWTVWPPKNMTTNQYFAVWGWAIQDNVNMSASTLLALLTSPLVWGLLIYTIWLIYCGTTTNETLKWSEWKDDMADGLAFRRPMVGHQKNERIEPRWTRWPVEAEQIVVSSLDGEPPQGRIPGEGPWERVWNLRHVENLYDMGFWDNLLDVFVADYAFGGKDNEPNVELRQRRRK